MKKVKLKIPFLVMRSIADALEHLIQRYPPKNHLDKIRTALWVECYLTFKEKTLFKYAGEKKVTLTFPRAIALLLALLLVNWEDEVTTVFYLQIIAEIDQQTA